MNIKTRVIQSNSLSFDIKNNNNSSILIKQSCLFKTTRPKQAYPYKIIPFGHASSSSHKNAPIMHNPDDKPSNCFILLMFSKLFNFHAIHEREPWIQHYRWNRMVVMEKTKRRRQSHINQAYQWAMEKPINRYQCE